MSSRPVRVKTDVSSSFRCVAVDLFVLSFRHILIICFVSKVTGLDVCLVWSAVAYVVSLLTQMGCLTVPAIQVSGVHGARVKMRLPRAFIMRVHPIKNFEFK